MPNKKLLTKISPISDIKSLIVETKLNNTDKISKITDLSVINATSFAEAKLLQKDLKETAIIESQMFPELSSGTYLDNAAKLVGGSSRYGAVGSSTEIYVVAAQDTVYLPGETIFNSTQGVQFECTELVTVDVNGYAYVPVRSTTTGVSTNVDALTINNVSPKPTGHLSCTNEYMATGGRDAESDEDFKTRLASFANFAATGNLLNIQQNLQLIDNRILFVINQGYNDNGQVVLSLVTNNGMSYLADELLDFESKLSNFVSINDINIQGQNIGIKLANTTWYEVGGASGVDFRIDIYSGYVESDVRRSIQVGLTKYLNFNYWTGTKVEWDNLLQIVKSSTGVKYIPDEYFLPKVDEAVPFGQLPRIKKFIMRDMDGNILYNNNNVILPVYYNL